jgi:uncharacterized membrane protein
MEKGRLEAFSDGVIAILITIMVLELRIPQGGEDIPDPCGCFDTVQFPSRYLIAS